MKFKSGFKLRSVAGENIVLALGEESQKYKGVIILNDTSAFLWKEIEQNGSDQQQLIDALKKEYAIDNDTAKRGVEKFITLIKQHNFIEE